jgi:uracil-DNA glycosylase
VIVCLGAFAWDAALRLEPEAPRPRALWPRRRGAPPSGRTLLGCFHPSQQNTFTGKLTEAMMDAVFSRARELAGRP